MADTEDLFHQIKAVLGAINAKLGVSAPPPNAGESPPPASVAQPASVPSFASLLGDALKGLAGKLGVETKGMAVERIDKEQLQAGKKVEEAKSTFEADRAIWQSIGKDLAEAMEQAKVAGKEMAQAALLLQSAQKSGSIVDVHYREQEHKAAQEKFRSTGERVHELQDRQQKAHEHAQQSRKGLYEAQKRLQETVQPVQGKIDFNKLGAGLLGGAKLAQAAGLGKGGSASFSEALNKGDLAGILGKGAGIAANVGMAMEGDPMAIASLAKESLELVKDNIKAIGGHIKGMGQAANKAMTSDRFEDNAGAMFEGAEHGTKAFARAIGGPITGPILEKMFDMNPMVKFSKSLVESVGTIRKWNDALHNANMQFARFSGAMATVEARQQTRDIQLGMERGNRRAPSAENLAESRHELNERLAVFEDSFAILKNNIMSGVSKVTTFILDWAPIIGPLQWALRKYLGEENKQEAFEDTLLRQAQEWYRQRHQEIPRHLREHP